MKDWKETIREVMLGEITLLTTLWESREQNRLLGLLTFEGQMKLNEYTSRLASLRNALDQFEKVVKEKDALIQNTLVDNLPEITSDYYSDDKWVDKNVSQPELNSEVIMLTNDKRVIVATYEFSDLYGATFLFNYRYGNVNYFTHWQYPLKELKNPKNPD